MRTFYIKVYLTLFLSVFSSAVLVAQTITFNYTGTIQNWTVPVGVTAISIQAKGAQGGHNGGRGAIMQGNFAVTPGQVLKILVGEQGKVGTPSVGCYDCTAGSGGGGTFVTTSTNTPLIVAGGGGGLSGYGSGIVISGIHASITTNGNSTFGNLGGTGGNGGGGGVSDCCLTGAKGASGGGGFFTDGANGSAGTGGKSFLNGGAGGIGGVVYAGYVLNGGNGGFGGGGSVATDNVARSGGGGGYSGGQGGAVIYGQYNGSGGGGGSFNAGTNQNNIGGPGGNTGNGSVIISVLFTGGAVGSDQSFCDSGAPSAFTSSAPASGAIVASYQWQISTDNITFTDIAGAAGLTYQEPSVLTQTTYYRRMATASNASISYSNTITVTINPLPAAYAGVNTTICSGQSASLGGPAVPGNTYAWTSSEPGFSGSVSDPSVNPSNGVVVYNLTETVTATGCSKSNSVSVTVNPLPAVNSTNNQTICNGGTSSAINFSGGVSGTTYNWTNSNTSIGLAASGTGNIAVFTAMNNGTLPVTATITVIPSTTSNGITCTGASQTFTITVNPTPTVNGAANQVICHNSPSTSVVFTGTVPGTVYNWTNSNTAIGLAASGSGDITSFSALNTSASPITSTITITPVYSNNGASCSGPASTFTITVNPAPAVNNIADQNICHGAPASGINFGGNINGAVYNWTNDNTSIGLAASGTGNIAAFNAVNTGSAPVTANITVTPVFTSGGLTCSGTAKTFKIIVRPTPSVNSNPMDNLCSGNAQYYTIGSTVSGTTFTWSRASVAGISNSPVSGQTASTISETLVNTTSSPVSVRYVIIPSVNGCNGPAFNYTVNVNPGPVVNTVASQTVCNGSAATAVNFAGNLSGTTYSWTNSNPSIGLPANGTGNIASFNAVNSTTSPVTASITVTPSYNGCTGTAKTFTITVNPTPVVNTVADQVVCKGSTVASTGFTPAFAGTTFSWTNSNPAIGLAASGNGSLPSFSAANNGTAPITGIITVTPYANGCAGSSKSFVLTVNPVPVVQAITSKVYCNNAAAGAVNFSGNLPGTIFNWTNSNPSIGLAGSGTGNLPSFTATNTGPNPVTATITVIPAYSSGGMTCNGTPQSFTITVNPTPSVNTIANQVYCSEVTVPAYSLTGPVPGTVYNWSNSNTQIGLAASGNGNISSFTAMNNTANAISATISVTPQANGCSGSTRTFTITVNPLPGGQIGTPGGVLLCPGTPLPLTVSGGVNYQWNLNGNPVPNATTANFNATQAGTYSVLIRNAAGCGRLAGNQPVIREIAKPTASFDFSTYCVNMPVSFISNSTSAHPVDYSWIFGNSQTSTQKDPSLTYQQARAYTVQLKVRPLGCDAAAATVSRTVSIESPIPAKRLPAVSVVAGSPTELQARSISNATYLWSPGQLFTGPANVSNPVIRTSQQADLQIRMTVPSGCVTTDTVLVRIIRNEDVDIPNAFSPNGDGIHDVWNVPYLKSFRDCIVEVYNRYGQLVYKSVGYSTPWNGMSKGSPLPVGTYYYVIDLKNGYKKVAGSLTILK